MSQTPASGPDSHTSPILEKCKPLLDRLTAAIRAYLQAEHDHPRFWFPTANSDGAPSWAPEESVSLRGLRIPALPTPLRPPYDPDLLLHRVGHLESLDGQFPARLEAITASRTHSLIVNASGTGKTRLLFETLSRSWGFYFTCYAHPTTSPYGSVDIGAVISDLPKSRADNQPFHRILTLRGSGAHSSKELLQHNQRMARKLVYCVLLTRLLFFNHVCTIASELGIADDVLRRRWLMIQLRPHHLLGQNDVFSIMARQLRVFPTEDLLAEARRALGQCQDRLQVVALDEAQIAMDSLDAAFATADGKTRAPILWELVQCMATLFSSQRLLVAGTRADISIVSDAVLGLPSPFASFRFIYSLGYFDTVEKTTDFLRHFFGAAAGDERCRQVHNLMQGRHRFMTLVVGHVLNEGIGQLDRVLNSLHKFLTGYSRLGSQHIRLPYDLILQDSRLDGTAIIIIRLRALMLAECRSKRVVRHATFRFALTRESSVYQDDAAALVALGIGLFCEPNASAILCEPLVFYRLLSWILASTRADIGSYLRPRSKTPGSAWRGAHVSAGLASYFWPAFSGAGRALEWCFTFADPSPFWTSHPALLTLPSGNHPAEHAVSAARSPDEVLEWLREGECPFLIPDAAFGADLLFWLNVEGAGQMLVALTTDPFSAVRPHRVQTVSPKDPSSFYAESPAHRERLLTFLRSLPPILFDVASPRRPAQRLTLNVLRVLCVARASKRSKPYNPPVATLDMGALLTLEHAPELKLSVLDEIVWGPSGG